MTTEGRTMKVKHTIESESGETLPIVVDMVPVRPSPAPAPVYVVGLEGRLHATREPPREWRWTPTDGGKEAVRYGWPNVSSAHTDQRGVLWEGKSLSNVRIFARVLPDDAVPELDELDAEIAAKESELQKLRAARQDLLAAGAVRGRRVRCSDAVRVEPERSRA